MDSQLRKTGLHPFDASITKLANAATIEATINGIIAEYATLFSDPITVDITFKDTSSGLGQSNWFIDSRSYSTVINDLISSASTTNDATALAHLPTGSVDPVLGHASVLVKTANLAALEPNSITSNPTGTISINTSICNVDPKSIDPTKHDFSSILAHEINEVLGLGSALDPQNGPTDILMEDLFRYDQNGNRSYTTSSNVSSYFSIDGTTDLAPFYQNQVNGPGDYGDWATGPIPLIQDAYQFLGKIPGSILKSRVELVALDAIGYHLILPPVIASPTATNVGPNSVTLGGNITDDGYQAILSRGVVYSASSVNSNPQIGGTGVTTLADPTNTTGIFADNITGLQPGTTYSFAAYVITQNGIRYTSPASTFTTPAAATTTSLKASSTSIAFSQFVTFTATVSDAAGPLNGGTVTFYNGAIALGGPVALNSDGTATFTTSLLPIGVTFVTATYSGSNGFTGSSSGPVAVSVQKATPTVTAIDPGGPYTGTPYTATFTAKGFDGSNVTGTATFTYYQGAGTSGPVLASAPTNIGTYTVVATFTSTDPNFSNGVSSPQTFRITQKPTTTTLGASPVSLTYGQVATLTATVSSPGATLNAGTVTFFDGKQQIGNPVVVINGVATLATTLPVGLHAITATYSGAGFFAASNSSLTSASIIQTVAGNGSTGFSGDNGIATDAELNSPTGIAVDAAGNLFIADAANNVIRKVNANTHVISTIAGIGTAGYSGDGGNAAAAQLNGATTVALDQFGDLFISDRGNNVIRKVVLSTGVITTVAGNGTAGYLGDFGAATSAALAGPFGIAVDAAGNLFIADSGNNVIRKVNAFTNLITTVAGNGAGGYSGDGGQATAAKLNAPYGIAVDEFGNLYIADSGNNVIRKVNAATQTITTIAGTGSAGFLGDGGQAKSAELNDPIGIAVDSAGNVFFSDSLNYVVREIRASNQTITRVAGNKTIGYSGDNGPATAAKLSGSTTVAMDAAGNLYIADTYNSVVRRVSAAVYVNVTPATPKVTVIDAGGPANGKPYTATFTATGINAAPVNGVANFTYYVGSNTNGTVLDSPPINVGTYTVIATFSSFDPNYTGATSLPLTFTIGLATTTTNVAASISPTLFGQPVTLTASVTSSAGTPNGGTIQFYDGKTLLGTALLLDTFGQTVYTTSTLSVGQHFITAKYSGTGSFAASSSAADPKNGLVVTVNPDTSPIVTGPILANLTSGTATLGGNVTSDGGATITSRGILYALTSTNAFPRIGGVGVTNVSAPGTTGAFEVNIAGLIPQAGYSYVAYATNIVGTNYTPVATFKTAAAPLLTGASPVVTFVKGSAPALIAPNLVVLDSPGATIASASVMISNWVDSEDRLSFLNPSALEHTFSVDFATNTATLTFFGSQTPEAYRANLRTVAYQDVNFNNPSLKPRLVSIVVSDGFSNSNTVVSSLNIQNVNLAPFLNLIEPTPLAYTANTSPQAISSTVLVNDSDSSNLTRVTVQISAGYQNNSGGQDSLSFVNQIGITGKFDAKTGTLILTGKSYVGNYRNAIRSVLFGSSGSAVSLAQRTLTIQAFDDGSPTPAFSKSMTRTVAVDNHLALTGLNGEQTFVKGSSPLLIAPQLLIVNAAVAKISAATVTIANWVGNEDRLNFLNPFALQHAFTVDAATNTAVLTFFGNDSAAHYEKTLQSLIYQDVNFNNPVLTARRFKIDVMIGGSAKVTATSQVSVQNVNLPPILTLIESTPLVYSTNTPPQPISSTLLVNDPDSNFVTKATVKITSGYQNNGGGNDLLSFASQNGIDGSFDPSTGTLTLTGTSYVGNYRTALRSVTFSTSGIAISTAQRTLTITAVDDNPGSPATSPPVTRTISVNPVLSLQGLGDGVTFVKGSTPLAIAPNLIVTEAANVMISSATVTFTNWVGNEDRLNFLNTYALQHTFVVGANGTAVLTLTGSNTSLAYQTTLRSIVYQDVNFNSPVLDGRSFTIAVTDGLFKNATTSTSLVVQNVNLRPVLSSIESTPIAYTGNSTPVAISSTLLVNDSDNTYLTQATVKITTGYQNESGGHDFLSFENKNGITGFFDSTTGTLTLTGTTLVGNYRDALRSVAFSTSGTAISTATRTLTIFVSDADPSSATSLPITRNVKVSSTLSLLGLDGQATFFTGSAPIPLALSLLISDYAGAKLNSATVTITNWVSDEDRLGFQNPFALRNSFIVNSNGTATLTLTGTDSLAHYQATLQSLTYQDVAGNPKKTVRGLTITVNDGLTISAATSSIVVR